MTKLNDLLTEQLDRVTTIFVAQMLREKVDSAGHTISDEDSERLAKHLLSGSKETFVWDEGNDSDDEVKLELTDEDVSKVEAQIDEFTESELPEIIEKTKDDAAAAILKTLKEDWPNQKAHTEEVGGGFLDRLEHDWGDAFDLQRMMIVISREVGQEFIDWVNEERDRRKSLKHGALLKLHARGCQVAMEIVCLMSNGFADGAFGRWRTLHEIAVVATILSDAGEELARRYLDHEYIEAKRAMDHFKINYDALGYDEPSQEWIDTVEKDYQRCLDEHGNSFGQNHGWANEYLGTKKATFLDLERAAGHIGSRSQYVFASYNVHASPKGINFRLGLVEQNETLLTGMSNVGFFEPGMGLAQSLVQLNLSILKDRWDFDTLVVAQILLCIRGEVPDAFHKVQNEIEMRA